MISIPMLCSIVIDDSLYIRKLLVISLRNGEVVFNQFCMSKSEGINYILSAIKSKEKGTFYGVESPHLLLKHFRVVGVINV